jgi:hypothetical protein
MEAFFGTSFSAVRIHVDAQASRIGALAFTRGSDIHFAPGRYAPDTHQGRELLGHELSHVVQQRAGRVRNPFGSGVAIVHEAALEAEAEQSGRRAAAAGSPPAHARHPIQRSIVDGMSREVRSLNLADSLLRGTDFGTTPVTLNNMTFPGGQPTQAVAEPLWHTENLDGGRVRVRLASEPAQHISARVLLPRTTAWTGSEQLTRLAQRIEGMREGFVISEDFIGTSGTSNASVEVHGLPDDARFAAMVRDHEYVHIRDLRAIIQAILVPWDTRMHNAFVARTTVEGASAAEAKAAFYAQMAGTPAEIGQAFYDELRRRGGVFHQTALGGPPRIARIVPERSRWLKSITVKVYYRHPADPTLVQT